MRYRTAAGTVSAIGLVILLTSASQLAAEVQRYYARLTHRGEMRLVGVTVTRGGTVVTFDADKLIGARVTHFHGANANLAVVPGSQPPAPGARDRLLGDKILNTGLLNPGGQARPLAADPELASGGTPGLAVEFARPVVNLPGDDVVLFELHRKLNSPPGGDAFHVSPLSFKAGLQSLTIQRFDITCDDATALPLAGFDLLRLTPPATSLAALQSAATARGNGAPLTDFQVLAVGIDLSQLGYAEGAAVDGLFFQDHPGSGLQVDPVLIAGLPSPVPANRLQPLPRQLLAQPEPGELLRQMQDGPLQDVEEIVYAERVGGFDHWYANFGFYAASVAEYPPQRGTPDEQIPVCFGEGGRLCRFNLRTGERTVLLDDPRGGVRDPHVHYDGKKILFSYRPGGQPYYHLYEIDTDGTNLVQLTDGPFDDIEPIYLPDGGVVFCSSRCQRYVNCHRTPVATLYRCDADGGNIRMLSCSIEHDNTPWMLPDGRVLYMRWEYVDRSQFCFHHLWTMNPDGTAQMVYFGNEFADTAMLDAKPIPGTNQVVASFSPGHGRPGHMGLITLIDPDTGPDNRAASRRLSRPGKYYRDPYPISDDCFLVADDTGIHVMDGRGATERICSVAAGKGKLTCHEPRPLVARRREPRLPAQTDWSQASGTLVLSDMYEGRNLPGVRPGEIRKLLILEQLPKPINFSGGMWPISVGGTFTLARILGTVPVEPDGSAHFQAPALRPLFFVALDDQDLSVKRMQSFLSVMPGERLSCVGCHEKRQRTPEPSVALAALQRPPSRIAPIDGVPDVLDYPRDVQPILNEHCVACHQAERMEGGVDLSGDHTPLFSVSYWTLMRRGLIADGRNERYGNRPPRTIGSSASRLLDLADGSHYDARPTAAQRKLLRLWIETSAVYAGTYAALGSGMHPVDFPQQVMERRCGACHGEPPPARPIAPGRYFRFGQQGPALPLVHEFTDLQQIRGRIGYYKFGNAPPPQSLCNLTRPEHSLLLRAPLASSEGGLERCREIVFQSPEDPDYQTLLARIRAAAALHRVEKRFDMPGFQPNVYYIRKLQSYGVLPEDLDPETPVDFYAADRDYWRSFWYRPPDAPQPADAGLD